MGTPRKRRAQKSAPLVGDGLRMLARLIAEAHEAKRRGKSAGSSAQDDHGRSSDSSE